MSRELVEREVLTPAQIDAIIDALNFCLADDWDEDSHSQSPAVYERALEKMQGLHGRVVKGNLRVALDEANAAFHAADRLARNAEARYAELQTKNKELTDEIERLSKGDGGEAVKREIIQEVCELPGDNDPDADDTLILSLTDLEVILDRALSAIPPVQRNQNEALGLLGELLDGPSKGEFYGIDGALRSKLETIRLTLQRAATPPVVDREAAKGALRRWHRDTCYPDASSGELDIGLDAIIALLPAVPDHIGDANKMVVVPRELAETIDQAFLPINPNKMRSAAPHVIEAAKRFKSLIAASPPMKGEDR